MGKRRRESLQAGAAGASASREPDAKRREVVNPMHAQTPPKPYAHARPEASPESPDSEDGEGFVDMGAPREAALFDPAPRAASPLVKLHDEILAFCEAVSPSAAERSARDATVRTLEKVCRDLWPRCEVKVFGSSLTRLELPSSDVDVCVFGASGARRIRELANELEGRRLCRTIERVESARIPLVKYRDRETGFEVDVSFDVEGGMRTAAIVKGFLRELPPLRPLVLVLKFFLAQRALNETFLGGVGSFMLQLMVVSFLQMRHRTDRATGLASAPNLGALLLEFLELYGRDFNYQTTGISVRHHGAYFPKQARGWGRPDRPWLLAIENPDDVSHDVGRNSYAVNRVRQAFDHAHRRITLAAASGDWRERCVLGEIVDLAVLNKVVAAGRGA
eukprot:CAMPEP_0119281306 /NCGR_PEP_ID=MMETSP1329-20130426/24458_1 /TAXON_ID=114041 /ORGANISM="Genus nov. species nov., Strain RCC1024" /LENGTH=391 /DNA_ID=CAMNT_0007281915 /DNA_START=104 /DNA_END=1275 /DNA_ORIENTATION=+